MGRKSRTILLGKSISLILTLALLVSALSSCSFFKKSDEELIEERIDAFLEAYNSGDFEALLESMDSKARKTYESAANLLGGLSFSLGGISGSLNFADLFGFSVGMISDGDLMSIDILEIEFEDDETAMVYCEMEYSTTMATVHEYVCFEMTKEDDDWFVHDMTDYNPEDYDFDVSKNTANTDSGEFVNSGTGSDPFAGVTFVVSGISPYCEIAINNAACSKDIQNYVTYSFDKEGYANGDTAIITATAKTTWSGEANITLSRTKYSYQVKDQPEYLSSVTNVNLATVKSELNDYITGEIGKAIGEAYFFSEDIWCRNGYSYLSSIQWNIQTQYFSVLKSIRQNEMDSDTPYNKYSFVLKCTATSTNGQSTILYVTVSANNVIKNTDGSIKWGLKSYDAYGFTYATNFVGLENCVTTTIMNNSANYNITRIS